MAQSIGEQLKQARLNRGLTLEQVSQATHIRKHYLEAMENDQRDALPSLVQGRGFLRLYASHLNLPVDPLLAAWEGKVQPVTPAAQDESQPVTAEPLPGPPDDSTAAEQENRIPSATAAAEAGPAPAGPEQSQAILLELGTQLRQQREALGLSWAEVERYTRLRQHYVQALEDGRMEDLPSPVQGRGMLSNYAAFLNLNEEKVLLRFAEALQARRSERLPKVEPQGLFSTKKRPARRAPFWKRFFTPDLIFGIGVVTIILFFALWTAARITSLGGPDTEPTPPGLAAILLTPASERITTGSPTELAAQSITGTPEVVDTAVPGTVSTQETAAPGLTTEQSPVLVDPAGPTVEVITGSSLATGTATLPAINSDPLQVYIVARQRAWLRVVTDGKVKFLGRVVPGNAYAFSAAKRIELYTGNAAAMQVFYNQNDLGTLGVTGQAVGMVFAPEGMMTPTPAFTATYTPTKPATVTPLPSTTPQPSPTITPFIP